jgi:hypothetical protein
MQVQVQGMNLARYAELGRVLEPYGARLNKVDGDTLTYQVTGNSDQLRAQLGLAKLQELPAETPVQPPAVDPANPAATQAAAPKPFTGLRFRW